MPKQVDHQARREQIAEAVLRIASREGIAAASIGRVAAEAGISKGLIQHYFGTKEAMLIFATGHLRARIEARLRRDLAALARPTPRTVLRTLLLAFLPLDDERRAEALIAGESYVLAITEPAVAERFQRGHRLVVDAVARQVREAQEGGAVSERLDPEQDAIVLLALLRGITTHIVLGYQTVDAAIATLDLCLDRLFAGECEATLDSGFPPQ